MHYRLIYSSNGLYFKTGSYDWWIATSSGSWGARAEEGNWGCGQRSSVEIS